MSEGAENENSGPDPIPTPPAEQEYPVDRLKARVGGVFAGRPLAVYLVLVAGAATLVILLIIVWISATGTTNNDRPICTTIATNDARDAVLNGLVNRVDVLVDADSPSNTLTGINLEFNDGSCRSTVQGADARDDLYLVLGAVDFYNNFADNRIRIHIQKQSIQPELLSTSTATPSATPPPTQTVEPTATSTVAPTHTATAEPTKRPVATATLTPQPTVETITKGAETTTPATATATIAVTPRPSATRALDGANSTIP